MANSINKKHTLQKTAKAENIALSKKIKSKTHNNTYSPIEHVIPAFQGWGFPIF